MSESFGLALKIWARAILLNSLFMFIAALAMEDTATGILAVLFIVIGFPITFPLMMVILPLIKISFRLPYAIRPRIAWLGFALMMVALLFYLMLAWMFGISLDEDFRLFVFATCVAIGCSIAWSRNSLIRLNEEMSEECKPG